jgi:hypothetical protein
MKAHPSLVLATLAASMPVAAEPPAPADAPSVELLEYLGTWNGDEEWMQSAELLPPPRTASQDPRNSQKPDLAESRDPAEQEK